MILKVGDKIAYNAKVADGGCITGEISMVWKNKRNMITSYFAILDSGFLVQFRSHNIRWSKLEESLHIPKKYFQHRRFV